jgi:hypothetical protein
MYGGYILWELIYFNSITTCGYDTRTLCIATQRKQQKKELNTTINIALNNGYRKEDIIHIHNKPEQRQNKPENNAKKEQKWVTFTYTGNYIRKITKLFKDTNLKIAFKTTSTTGKLLNEKQETNSYEQNKDVQGTHKKHKT